MQMTLFQKYEVSCSETKLCGRICIEKIACRHYTQLSVLAYKLLPSQYHYHQTDFRSKYQRKVCFELLKLILQNTFRSTLVFLELNSSTFDYMMVMNNKVNFISMSFFDYKFPSFYNSTYYLQPLKSINFHVVCVVFNSCHVIMDLSGQKS